MQRLAVILVAAAATLAGCAGTVSSDGTVVAGTYGPDLVYVSPGVSVVADYPDSVFYTNNYYWRYDGGRWYRSNYYDRGWRRWGQPPTTLSRIDRPHRYRYYRPAGTTVRRDRPATYPRGGGGGVIRDHRR